MVGTRYLVKPDGITGLSFGYRQYKYGHVRVAFGQVGNCDLLFLKDSVKNQGLVCWNSSTADLKDHIGMSRVSDQITEDLGQSRFRDSDLV